MKVLSGIEVLKKTYDKLLIDVAKSHNLKLIELKILLFLEKNELNVAKDIADGIKATKSHVSMSVCDLEKKGYIEKVKDDNDKKKWHLQLTEKALPVIDEGSKVQKKMKDIMFAGISKEEKTVLTNVAKTMKENLEKYNRKTVI